MIAKILIQSLTIRRQINVLLHGCLVMPDIQIVGSTRTDIINMRRIKTIGIWIQGIGKAVTTNDVVHPNNYNLMTGDNSVM